MPDVSWPLGTGSFPCKVNNLGSSPVTFPRMLHLRLMRFSQ